MLRLLVTALWIYIVYRVLRWAMVALGAGLGKEALDRRSDSNGVNQMVKDPVCGTYVLARDSKSLRVHGKTYYFCSDDCRERFANK